MPKAKRKKLAKQTRKSSSQRKVAWVEKTPNGGMVLHLALVEPANAAEERQMARAQKKWWDWRRSLDPDGFDELVHRLADIYAGAAVRDILQEENAGMDKRALDKWVDEATTRPPA